MSSLKASGETKVSNGMSKIEPAWPLLDGSIVHMTKSQCKYVTARSQLGDGNFSVVKECMNVQTNERYAMKLIPKRLVRGRLRLIQREVAVLKLASARVHELEERNREGEGRSSDNWGTFEGHHHVLQLFDYFETRDNIVLVTQLCEQGDLYDRIINAGSLDVERQVKPYTACLLSALSFLHENGIVHRDIKAENILFRLHEREAPENAKYDVRAHDLIVADFGLAVSKDDTASLKEYVGTLSYLAPEVVRCKDAYKLPAHESEQVKIYGTGIDVWALGVLCYFMVSGYMPFDCEEDAETSECILQGDYYVDEEAQSEASESFKQCWNFMQQCFTCDDRVRPSAKDLMGHVFVRSYFQSVEAKVFSEIPFMEKSKSSTSLHNLGPPTRSPMVSPRVSFREQKGIPRADSRERNLNKLRDTLRKTLSMTSLEPMSTRSGLFAALAAVDPNRKNSTFVLEPEPPSQSLMNGCYSITPESQSNFHVTPSMSRKSSGNNVLESNNTTVFMSVPGKQCFTMPAMDTAMAGGRARSTAFHLGDDDDDHY